ncbi:uncharacterized protein CANTADRAFT_55694 [Suhomyces tanzawaensis NRRL Y-17324]|uniref:Nucleoporin n=1 Tax=Suhomyces tanzawaensis NRRL Y-17324 TaxID=984487 RepID=A0A1E4SCI1_9ASCO|nr:uncharacterized protein CANTADRAFT_55694 [Suhomyces tanzawaensis NRRL Y-17324]ODV77205.1 hypothetical protein CANTADRAFT_55694 [Suhomyces tanzawaensis NRRL Y-17324]
MSSSSQLHWSTDLLAECYNSIQTSGSIDHDTLFTLKKDLLDLLKIPSKNEESRKRLSDESKPTRLYNGDEFKFNSQFVEETILLSSEFDLDEVMTAELALHAQPEGHQKGTSFKDTTRYAFYARYQYILNIVGYLASNNSLHLTLEPNQFEGLFQTVLDSFEKIYKLVNFQNDLIEKQKVTSNINDLLFINAISFSKSQLFKCHETLSLILYTLIDNYFDRFGTLSFYTKIMDFATKNIQNDDSLSVQFLPVIFKFIINLLSSDDEAKVDKFHKYITSELSKSYKTIANNDIVDLTNSNMTGLQITSSMIFFTFFTTWCKQSQARTDKYDFKEDIVKYMEWAINFDFMEWLLCYTSESCHPKTLEQYEWSNVYDFRSLLQKTCPKLSPKKFIYPMSQDLLQLKESKQGYENVSILTDLAPYKISESSNESLLAPFFHKFFVEFVTNAALLLILLRDSEEDFLLSSMNRKQLQETERGEGEIRPGDEDDIEKSSNISEVDKDTLDLDEISTRSDLERFYLAFAYTYSNRSEICSLFWTSESVSNDIMGFFSWGLSNNTSPLITATFCLLLGSLTSGGNDSASKIWEILITNNHSSMKKNDYSKISIDSILNSLNYYIDSLKERFEENLTDKLKQQQKRQEFLFSSNSVKQDNLSQSKDNLVIELAEDSLVFISGFVQLISSVFKNLSSDSKDIKLAALNRFYPIINGFLYFDNLITGGKNLSVDVNSNNTQNPKYVDLPNITISEENRVILINLMLNLLNNIVEDEQDLSIRFKVWEILDRWLYHGMSEGENPSNSIQKDPFLHQSTRPKYINKRLIRLNQGFEIKLKSLSQVSNFIRLVSNLLTPLSNQSEAFAKYSLLYPVDLGSGYRINNSVGIWPYIEYLMVEAFGKSNRMTNFEDQTKIKTQVVKIIKFSLEEVDWVFLTDTSSRVIHDLTNFNEIFESNISGLKLDYKSFIKLHHSIPILNYLFDEKVYKSLMSIINIGQDTLDRDANVVKLVETALNVVEDVLKLQNTFIKTLLPIMKDQESVKSSTVGTHTSLFNSVGKSILDNVYTPATIGTNGVTDFFEILLFNLSVIPQIALYVGNSSSERIVFSSINILSKISSSSFFITSNNESILRKNRLLSTFESIDESIKIKYAFISQFESLNVSMQSKILEFLLENLHKSNGTSPNVGHFLLGYEIHGGNLFLTNPSSSDELSHNTLLRVLLNTLEGNLTNLGDGFNVQAGPSKISSLILETIIKLSQDAISSHVTLTYLRDFHSLFEKLLDYQPKIDLQTLWEELPFNGDLDEENKFIESEASYQALFSFINQRTLILQYLSLEFHNIQSITKKDHYAKLLLNIHEDFISGSSRILNFLDVLNFKFKNFDITDGEMLNQKFDLETIVEDVKGFDFKLDFGILDKIVKIVIVPSNQNTQLSQTFISQPAIDTSALTSEIIVESNKLHNFINKFILSTNLRNIQLKCLHSWCQLIEILITDPKISRHHFILEVLQIILPKINDYLETDILFSEELISLSVLLFDLYDKEILEKSANEDFLQGMQRLTSLFKTCITGILNSNSTPNLRSNLYVLTNKFLLKVFKNQSMIDETSSIIRSIDKKFIEIILNDSIYSEGSSRITSILLLESLIHLSSFSNQNFVLKRLIKNNSLLLLVKSIKRTDEMIQSLQNGKGGEGISLETLLFELTAFKSTLYFLIRVSQSKPGALQLIQCEIFSIIKQCSILKINPDLGMSLNLGDHQDVKISLVLDAPVGFNELGPGKNSNNVSYFEFLVPIFQLVVSIVLSMGPTYKPSLIQCKDLLKTYDSLVVGIMKRDLLIENNQHHESYKEDLINLIGLKEVVKLLTILDSLIHYEE